MNNYNGQSLVLDGNAIGEFFVNNKYINNGAGSHTYSAVCPMGSPDKFPLHFINKNTYDGANALTLTQIASNQRYTGATFITVDKAAAEPVITCVAADFDEVLPFFLDENSGATIKMGDRLYINTVANVAVWVTIKEKISTTSVRIIADDAALLTAEGPTAVAATAIILQLNNPKTVGYDKRRFDLAASYIYL